MPDTLSYAEPSTPTTVPVDAGAVRSVKLGLLFILTPVPSMLAILAGRQAVVRIRNQGGRGRGVAWTGIALGVAGIIAWIWFAFWLADARRRMLQVRCMSNLRDLGQAMYVYAYGHGGAFPDGWDELIAAGAARPEQLVCPADDDATPVTRGATTRATLASIAAGGHVSYVYVGRGMSVQNLMGRTSTAVIAYDLAGTHGHNVLFLFADGHVGSVFRAQAIELIQALHDRPAPAAAARMPPMPWAPVGMMPAPSPPPPRAATMPRSGPKPDLGRPAR
jgi:hypothetical protein